tara:strand:- start:957 stop:1085 length:129 start_codon:yes stop_codon:yes gene_type:complete
LEDKKAAKKIIKLAKKHPEWYSDKDVYYAKMIKKKLKKKKND